MDPARIKAILESITLRDRIEAVIIYNDVIDVENNPSAALALLYKIGLEGGIL